MRSIRASLSHSLLAFSILTSQALAQEAGQPPLKENHVVELASCDVCMPTSIPRGPIQVLFQPGFQAGVDHQFTPFKGLHLNGEEIANPAGEKINSNTTQLHLTYNLSPKFGLLLNVPYHDRNYRRQGASGVEQGNVSGLGDVVVRARYAPVTRFDENSTLVWTVEAGMKLPTGNSSLLRQSHQHSTSAAPTHQHGEEAGEHEEHEHEHEEGGHHRGYLAHEGHEHEEPGGGEEEHHETPSLPTSPALTGPVDQFGHTSAVEGHDLALGSGSVDGVIGTGVLYRQGNFFAAGGGQYVLRSTGTAGYKYGDLLTWRVAPGYLIINKANQVVGIQANISGEHHDPNTLFGQRNHGYTDIVYAGPEVITQGENLSLNLGVDFPVKYSAEGLTLAPDYRARMHFNWRF